MNNEGSHFAIAPEKKFHSKTHFFFLFLDWNNFKNLRTKLKKRNILFDFLRNYSDQKLKSPPSLILSPFLENAIGFLFCVVEKGF
jgi:hypothetical protein